MSPAERLTYQTLEDRTKALTTALGFRDQSTLDHSDRVQALATELGMAAGLSERQIRAISISAMFNDIGKIGIHDRILMKPGQLDTADGEWMTRHPQIGRQMILSTHT